MNFKRYNESDNSWTDSHYIMGTDTDTLSQLPTTIYPNDTSVTVGIKGNTTQSGTPSPSNPVDVLGTGERTGNLYLKKMANATINADGSIISNNSFDCYLAKVEANKQYIGTGFVYSFFVNEPFIGSGGSYDGQRVVAQVSDGFTSPIDGYVAVRHNTGVTDAMLNKGSTPLPYEPYGYKIPISSNSTTYNKYLGEEQTVRQIKKLVLTGEENWTKNDTSNPSNYLYYQTGYLANKTCVCSHLADMGTLSASKVGIFNGNNVLYLNFGSAIMNAQPSGNTVAGLKEYLAAQYAAGTPVTVWYVLATPETEVINEPLMKIGTYADSLTTSIPCTAGENTLDVQTTVQPSEVAANYHGWHPVASVHERENGQWN